MIIVATLLTFLLSLLLPVAVKPLLLKLGIMDVPSARSSHTTPVVRGLGLAVLIAMVGGLTVMGLHYAQAVTVAPNVNLFAVTDFRFLAVVAVGTLAAGFLGLSEDMRGVSVAIRSVSLLSIAVFVSAFLIWTPDAWTSELPIVLQILLIVYAILFISSFINVGNFMDGLNGISGFHGVLAGVTFALAGFFCDVNWLIAVGAILAAAFAGFLPWNLRGPGAFLGDVGSYLLGGAIAVTSFAALVSGVPILATIGPMICYFGDVGVTLVQRMRAGYKWDEPHKEHVYQRVQQLGYSHVATSFIIAGFSAVGCALGLVSCFVAPIWWLVLLVAGLLLVVVYLQLPRILPRRNPNF